ncbi:hypothetical protein HZS_3580, partial [Henneguya salminicola]
LIIKSDKKYELNQTKIDERYRNLIKTLHPDKFETAPDNIKKIATEFTKLIKDAKNILTDPYLRACYLVKL